MRISHNGGYDIQTYKASKNFAVLTEAHPVVTAFSKNNLYTFLPLINSCVNLKIPTIRKKRPKKYEDKSMPPKN